MAVRSRFRLSFARSAAGFSTLLLLALVSLNASPRRGVHHLEVSPTRGRNARALGAEVWLRGLRGSDGVLTPASVLGLPPGWVEREGALLAPDASSGTLEATVWTPGPIRLEFGAHRWSGTVRVRWDGTEKALDLFDENGNGVRSLLLPDRTSSGAPRLVNEFLRMASGDWLVLGLLAAALASLWFSFPPAWRVPGGVPAGRVALAQGIVASAWIAFLSSACLPGILTYDSLEYLRLGLEGRYVTQHPALLCAAVAAGFHATGSTWPLVLLQLAGFPLLLFAIGRQAATPRESVFIPAVLLLAPPVWTLAPVLWKDTCFTVAMLGAASALARKRLLPAALLLSLATLLRLNGIVAAAPLLVPLALVAVRPAAGRSRRGARALVVLAGFAGLALLPAASNALFRTRDSRSGAWLQIHDLAGIYVRRPALYPGSILEKRIDLQRLSSLYSPLTNSFLMFEPVSSFPDAPTPPSRPLLDPEWVTANHSAISSEWRRMVASSPGAYLRHRLQVTARLFSFPPRPSHYPFAPGTLPSRWGFSNRTESPSWRLFSSARALFAEGPLFQGWTWLAALVGTGSLLFRKRPATLGAWVALSGLAYAGAYVFVAPAADFRFLAWTVVSLGGALLLRSHDCGAGPASPGKEREPLPSDPRGSGADDSLSALPASRGAPLDAPAGSSST